MDLTRRNFALGAGLAVLGATAPFRTGAALAKAVKANPAPFDPTPYVHPELRFAVPDFVKYKSFMPFDAEHLPQLRKLLGAAPAVPEAQKVEIPASAGDPAVLAYVLRGQRETVPKPAILYMHGGGFVSGSAAAETAKLLKLARDLDCVIVAVEYRLAPETPFPGPLNDCYAALKWVHGNALRLGIDPARIAIMGESAGGGLAAMLAIAARDRREVPVSFQLLVYPMLDDRTGSSRSIAPPLGTLIWDQNDNRFGWSSFLGKPAGSARIPEGAVPARTASLSGLPPTFIAVGSIDLFVLENVAYARRLIESGIATELLVVPGAFHGFEGVAPEAGVSRQFRGAIKDAMAKAFATR